MRTKIFHFFAKKCNRVLIVLTPNFIKSPTCEVQATFAVSVGCDEKCRKIVPILVEPCDDIPWLLRFRAIIDFTKPGMQDWIWDILKSSLRDVPSSSGFISSSKRQVQRRPELTQSCSSDCSNPSITFPPTTSHSLNTGASSNFCKTPTTSYSLNTGASFCKRQVQRRPELTQSSSSDCSNPIITFPPTTSHSLNTGASSNSCQTSTASYSLNTGASPSSCKTSTAKLVHDKNTNDKIATNIESSTKPKQKNKSQNRRSVERGDIAFSSGSVSSPNVARTLYRQRSRGLGSTDISNGYSQDTSL